jgi:adenine-specific DNA-methyltransferase
MGGREAHPRKGPGKLIRKGTLVVTRKKDAPVQIESFKYKDKRVNIPTEELRDFVVEDEKAPKQVLYPRDPSLDPQLVWKGKDQQDQESLSVPSVPVYIQEKIEPRAIIEGLRSSSPSTASEQPSLFADFDGLGFEQTVEFYRHDQNWSNRLILGDSLLAMTSLVEKEGLKSKVQTMYMDPPYGIKFGSNWQVSTNKRDVKDGKIEDLTPQPEQVRAFRDTWKLGIHSYLHYLRDRLIVARDLLTDSGSIFVQIGDENAHLVRCLLDEVFGSDNYVAVINYTKTSGQTARYLSVTTDYVLWYSKDIEQLKYRPLYLEKALNGDGSAMYQYVEFPDGTRRRLTPSEKAAPGNLPSGSRIFRLGDVTSQRQNRPSGAGTAMYFGVELEGKTFFPPGARGWSATQDGMRTLAAAGRLVAQGARLAYVRYLDDFPAFALGNDWTDTAGTTDRVYVVQTNTSVIQRCLLMTTDPGDLVLDPTCGSGTTAFVAEQWGRRWITIDTSRVALAVTRVRLMSAKFPYYVLKDSVEGIQREAGASGSALIAEAATGDLKRGFVYRRVPHVTLKSIANNPDVREGMSHEEIEAAIAKHADSEALFDQPFEDRQRIRVTGPFTVESLSPYQTLSSHEERPLAEERADLQSSALKFESMILENLRKADIQTNVKSARLKLTNLEPYAGRWINASGPYTDAEGTIRRAAVSIGPQYDTVGPDFVKEAAKEAVQGVGFDVLVVCGFAFDPHVSQEAKRYGRLTVLITRLNPDLTMGDELLKKTGVGNLFMVFGEPDMDVLHDSAGKLTVDLHGIDVYDPTTGEIRSDSTDKIACWFIDTNYNGESFFVRHAYFTGANQPYEKLKKALKSDIDEGAWASLYTTTSRPFDPPSTGKIAVKVINDYGDEVLKVYDVSG